MINSKQKFCIKKKGKILQLGVTTLTRKSLKIYLLFFCIKLVNILLCTCLTVNIDELENLKSYFKKMVTPFLIQCLRTLGDLVHWLQTDQHPIHMPILLVFSSTSPEIQCLELRNQEFHFILTMISLSVKVTNKSKHNQNEGRSHRYHFNMLGNSKGDV